MSYFQGGDEADTSIIEKLRRESIRLTQIQDIAGSRLTVSDVAKQESVMESLKSLLGHTASVIDRRQRPSHGYRAVHVVISFHGKLIEIQVRTELQHLWAELSEKLSDVLDPAIKYGGGDETVRDVLAELSDMVGAEELLESQVAELQVRTSSMNSLPVDVDESMKSLQQEATLLSRKVLKTLRDAIEHVEKLRGKQ